MDITKNLQLETRRLYGMGIDFRMFEHSIGGKVGVVVKTSDNTKENASKLLEAGYELDPEVKRNNFQVYTIEVAELVDKHKHMMELIELESNRLAVNGVTYYRYDVTADSRFSISVLSETGSSEIARKLTEVGYNFDGWSQRDMSEFSIPLADLEEIHGVSLAENPE